MAMDKDTIENEKLQVLRHALIEQFKANPNAANVDGAAIAKEINAAYAALCDGKE